MQAKPSPPPVEPRRTSIVARLLQLRFGAHALVLVPELWLFLGLSGCGMETAATAVTAAKAQGQQAQAAQRQLDAIKQQLEQAKVQLDTRTQEVDAATR